MQEGLLHVLTYMYVYDVAEAVAVGEASGGLVKEVRRQQVVDVPNVLQRVHLHVHEVHQLPPPPPLSRHTR